MHTSLRFLTLKLLWALTLAPAALADLPSEPMPEASRSMLLDCTMAGDRVIAVGERGHILLSDDYGESWRQAKVPTRSTLTAVSFPDALNGWVVGHDNIVLHTADGGESWKRQYLPIDPDNHMLDVLFVDDQLGFVVGAYGMGFQTTDGGLEWQFVLLSEEEMHINRITRGPAGNLYLSLEWGGLFSSGDNGQSWQEMDSPYDGSLFGLLPLSVDTMLVYGLRGNVYRTTDRGTTWAPAKGTAPVLVIDGIRTASGEVILAGQNGEFLISENAGRDFSIWKVPVMGASSILEMPDGSLLATGVNGAWRLKPADRQSLNNDD